MKLKDRVQHDLSKMEPYDRLCWEFFNRGPFMPKKSFLAALPQLLHSEAKASWTGERLAKLVSYRYGLAGEGRHSFEEAAALFGVHSKVIADQMKWVHQKLLEAHKTGRLVQG